MTKPAWGIILQFQAFFERSLSQWKMAKMRENFWIKIIIQIQSVHINGYNLNRYVSKYRHTNTNLFCHQVSLYFMKPQLPQTKVSKHTLIMYRWWLRSVISWEWYHWNMIIGVTSFWNRIRHWIICAGS